MKQTLVSHPKTVLLIFSGVALAIMVPFTVRATFVRGVLDNAHLMEDVWFQVTLIDAYLAFLAVYLFIWVAETSMVARLFWLLLLVCFGSMGIAAYLLVFALTNRSVAISSPAEKSADAA